MPAKRKSADKGRWSEADAKRHKNGTFQPGQGGPGRKPGIPNRTTTLLKDAILQAAQEAGGGDADGLARYLRGQAKANPGPFMSLLGKVLPMQITSEGSERIVVEIVKSERSKNKTSE